MKPWLTIAEAALTVGRHKSRIYRWIKKGNLRTRVGIDGKVEVQAADLLNAEANAKPGRPTRRVST